MGEFVKVAKASEIHSGHGKIIKTATSEVVIFNAGGAFYAIENRCPFCHGSLLEGSLQGSEIDCACDKAKFYLPTGEVICPRPGQALATYRVRIKGDEITVHLGHVPPWRVNERELLAAQDLEVPMTWKFGAITPLPREEDEVLHYRAR